jgi:hypothetical protein
MVENVEFNSTHYFLLVRALCNDEDDVLRFMCEVHVPFNIQGGCDTRK